MRPVRYGAGFSLGINPEVMSFISAPHNDHVDTPQKLRVGAALNTALTRMPSTMKRIVLPTIKKVHVYQTPTHLHNDYIAQSGRALPENQFVAGFFRPSLRSLFLTHLGDHEQTIGVHAHELGHALSTHTVGPDGKTIFWSNHPDWHRAYFDEIDAPFFDVPPLTANARISPEEGFAEYVRQVVQDKDYAREKFPQSWEFLRKRGVV